MLKKILFFVFIFSATTVQAQRWKFMRYEVSFGLGMSNFLGELGGANQIGTHYFKDYEFKATRLAASLGMRYKLSNYFALKSHFTYGRLAGNDSLTEEFYRHYRNLNFFSDIYEFNINFEGAFQQEQIGHRYRLKRVKGLRTYEIYMYAFGGVGVFYFNPKTTINGKVVELRPLRTEGEGLVASRKQYSLIQLCIPVGIGFKYSIDRRWGIGLQLGLRKTFTDYIDDVSTTYFDFTPYMDKLTDYNLTIKLADRSDKSHPTVTQPNMQRGDPRYKDSYIFGIFSANYKLRNDRRNLPLF